MFRGNSFGWFGNSPGTPASTRVVQSSKYRTLFSGQSKRRLRYPGKAFANCSMAAPSAVSDPETHATPNRGPQSRRRSSKMPSRSESPFDLLAPGTFFCPTNSRRWFAVSGGLSPHAKPASVSLGCRRQIARNRDRRKEMLSSFLLRKKKTAPCGGRIFRSVSKHAPFFFSVGLPRNLTDSLRRLTPTQTSIRHVAMAATKTLEFVNAEAHRSVSRHCAGRRPTMSFNPPYLTQYPVAAGRLHSLRKRL